MSVDYLLTYPMIDHSGKVVGKVASYYRVLEVSSSGQLFTGSWVATPHTMQRLADGNIHGLITSNFLALMSALEGFKANG